jgi:hypothetical protein
MSKKGFILCVCQGTCPSFTKMDIFGVLSDIRNKTTEDAVAAIKQLAADNP